MRPLTFAATLAWCLFCITSYAQDQEDQWPQTFTATDHSVIRIYEPQAESFRGNVLKGRAAFSVTRQGQEPVFGTFWAIANVDVDRDNRTVHVLSVKVPNLKLARDSGVNIDIGALKADLENSIPQLNLNLSLDAILSSLDLTTEEKDLSRGLKNTPPKIIYRSEPSLLVTMDGQPMLQHNKDWNVDMVVNTPFTIIKNGDKQFYLYGGRHWYVASAATGPYQYVNPVPDNLRKIQQKIDAAQNANPGYTDSAAAVDTSIYSIIVSTEPAELIQSKGDPVYPSIPGTGLSYISNSNNDIFRDSASGAFYTLLAGRWYRSQSLRGKWQYVAADSLPPGFARIPEGSPKDNVLASVAGTEAAREAVMDAQIPQTARVDRKNAQTNVSYDGKPKFQSIPGTHLQYAVNSPNPVLLSNGIYYCVDDGVWFQSNDPNGPWQVCTQRPDEVDLIPPSCPIYNIKYVYIYDVDPDWVYMGYTPGYLNNYIYGPTVVYGTGFYYDPWRGTFFYPRPWTWGFDMWYDPWFGWTFGPDYGLDWFTWGIGWGWGWDFWFGGWWGPMYYHPAYVGGPWYHRGLYGRNSFMTRNHWEYHNNLYRARSDVYRSEFGGRVMTDREGNVFRRNAGGDWERRFNGAWRPVDGMQRQFLNRQDQLHDRGLMRSQNFQLSRGGGFGGNPGGGFRGGFGGGFHGGGFHGGGFHGGGRR